jgi:hypothetical protein
LGLLHVERLPERPGALLMALPHQVSSPQAAVIETMGFSDADYRERKWRSHALMSRAVGGAPVIMHDFHEPAGRSQPDRDREFWRAVRWKLSDAQTGRSENDAGDQRVTAGR